MLSVSQQRTKTATAQFAALDRYATTSPKVNLTRCFNVIMCDVPGGRTSGEQRGKRQSWDEGQSTQMIWLYLALLRMRHRRKVQKEQNEKIRKAALGVGQGGAVSWGTGVRAVVVSGVRAVVVSGVRAVVVSGWWRVRDGDESSGGQAPCRVPRDATNVTSTLLFVSFCLLWH